MFCKYCGQQIADEAAFCAHCGRQLNGTQSSNVNTNNAHTNNSYTNNAYNDSQPYNQPYTPVAGFILSFFICIAGLIVSIIEYKKVKQYGGNGTLALAGIIVGAIGTGILALAFLSIGCTVCITLL